MQFPSLERLEWLEKEFKEDGYNLVSDREVMQLVDLAIKIRKAEPDAYVTYKGYLLHASDPKVAEHSEPTPLYDLTDIIDGE